MGELARGVHDVGRGFAFLNAHPRLWGWVIAPAVVTLLLLAGVIVGVVLISDSLVSSAVSWLPSWFATTGGWLVRAIVVTGLVLGGLLVFVSVAGIVAGPFNELLSEAVEERLTGTRGPGFSLAAFARGAVMGVAHGLRRLLVTLLGIALLFALGFVPVVGSIAALVLGGYFAARGTAYDCYDAVLSRKDLAYGDKLAFLRTHRSRALGLGAAVAGLLLVPGLNLIALGLGSTGATLAAHDLRRRG
jgi:CysZ protein